MKSCLNVADSEHLVTVQMKTHLLLLKKKHASMSIKCFGFFLCFFFKEIQAAMESSITRSAFWFTEQSQINTVDESY